MAIFVRDQNAVVFLFESGTFASPSGTSGNWIGLVTNHSLVENENYNEIRYAGTNNRNYGQLIGGPKDYDGTITFHPQNWRMYAFALGSCVDTSGATTKHVISEINSNNAYAFTSGTSQLTNFPSFTIKDSKKGLSDGNHAARTINGCVVDTWKLTASNNKPIVCEVTYKGQAFALGSKTTDIVPIRDADSSRPYIWSDSIFYISGTTPVNEVDEIVYEVNNKTAVRHFVNGSKVAQAFVPTTRIHTISLKMPVNSTWYTTLNNYQKSGTTFNASLAATIAATENGTWTFSGCEVTVDPVETQAEGIDTNTVTIRPQSVSFIGSDTVLLYNPY